MENNLNNNENARQAAYDAVALAVGDVATNVRELTLKYARENEYSSESIAEMKQTDFSLATENIASLAGAWIAMDISDHGVGELLMNFVDIMNAPVNAKNVGRRNIERILDVADKLRAHLVATGSASSLKRTSATTAWPACARAMR